jgi:hypothetical protein
MERIWENDKLSYEGVYMIRKVAIVVFAIVVLSLFVISPNTNILSQDDTSQLEVTARPKSIVPLEKIVSGGPSKDGIPSIDNPKFVRADEATFLLDADMVIGVQRNGITKAYPHKILVWHEIVNDMFQEDPVVITYCPLCYSSIAFLRVLDGRSVQFGTSGRLYNSDLVMYDKQPGSTDLTALGLDLKDAGNLWSQMSGQALVGDRSGQRLISIPADVMEWKDWRRLHLDTLVLSTETGYQRSYGVDPYSDYYASRDIQFPVENRDGRLFEKEVILGIEYNGKHKAYRVQRIEDDNVINDEFQANGIVLFRVGSKAVRAFETDIDGRRLTFRYADGKFIDNETGSTWNEHGMAVEGKMKGSQMKRANGHIAFWFAWVAFYPETEVKS